MQVSFMVNEKEVKLEVPPDRRLVDILRDDLKLTGTKIGCGEGECGACTVIMDDLTVNSCLVPACQLQGKKVTTIEGLTASGNIDHIIESFVEEGAVQCGYCIPGIVVSTYHLLENFKAPTQEEIKRALSGNLCRCTGYAKVIKAVGKASEKHKVVNRP